MHCCASSAVAAQAGSRLIPVLCGCAESTSRGSRVGSRAWVRFYLNAKVDWVGTVDMVDSVDAMDRAAASGLYGRVSGLSATLLAD